MQNTGVIFKRKLRDSVKATLGWGIGMSVYALYIVIVYPYLEQFEELNKMMEMPIIQAMLGSETVDLVSPGGFIGNYFFLFAPLILAIFSVLNGLSITITEEDSGTLDLLLSMPVTRSQIILEKFAANTVSLVIILLISMFTFVIGKVITPSLDVALGDLLLGMINIVPIIMLLTALTMLLSTVLRSKGSIGGIMAAFVVASYFLNTLPALMEEPLKNLQYVSIFHYYGGQDVLTKGMNWGGFLLLSVLCAFLTWIAVMAFRRRDLGS